MEQFLDEYLKPLSSRIVKAPVGPDLSEQSEEIAELFKECRDNISTLFDHYASLAPPAANQRSGSWKRVESMNSTVSLKETTKFAEDFNIVPALLSKMEVGRLMRVVTGNQDLALDLDRFVEWLGRAALHGELSCTAAVCVCAVLCCAVLCCAVLCCTGERDARLCSVTAVRDAVRVSVRDIIR